MLPSERKRVEPLAARVEPGRVRAAHQSLHHFVAKAPWDDGAVLDAVREMVPRAGNSPKEGAARGGPKFGKNRPKWAAASAPTDVALQKLECFRSYGKPSSASASNKRALGG